jgi:hypothetical protein
VTEFHFHFYTPLASQWRRPMPKTLPVLRQGKQWFGFLQIPEGRAGKFAVRHRRYPAGTKFNTVTARTAIFAQHVPVDVIASTSVIVHELCEGSGVWMTDLPIEQFQIDPMLDPMRGRVLVGGLGLGYAAQTLARMRSVMEVVVIEKSPEVIELVARNVKGTGKRKVRVIEADLHVWLRDNQHERFDWAFYDIWAPDGERVFFDHVVPLRRLTGPLCNPEHVRCWNEDVMRGQILMHGISMLNAVLTPALGIELSLDKCCEPLGGKWHATHDMLVPFFRAIRGGQVARDVRLASVALADFVRDYGIPGRKVLS